MRKTLQKFVVVLTVCTLFMYNSAFAAGYTVKTARINKPENHFFFSSWKESKSFYYDDVYIGTITYGFSKVIKLKDYTWVYSDFYTHYAAVTNDNGLYESGDKLKAVWAKKEITHKGSSQIYESFVKGFEYNCTRWDFELK